MKPTHSVEAIQAQLLLCLSVYPLELVPGLIIVCAVTLCGKNEIFNRRFLQATVAGIAKCGREEKAVIDFDTKSKTLTLSFRQLNRTSDIKTREQNYKNEQTNLLLCNFVFLSHAVILFSNPNCKCSHFYLETKNLFLCPG